jgi:hypothetical protein
MSERYPLDVRSVGEDTYIVMSKGHHDLDVFMNEVIQHRPSWNLGGPEHVWVKTTPGKGTYDRLYNFVPKGTRGAWPATYCWEYGDGWEKWRAEK